MTCLHNCLGGPSPSGHSKASLHLQPFPKAGLSPSSFGIKSVVLPLLLLTVSHLIVLSVVPVKVGHLAHTRCIQQCIAETRPEPGKPKYGFEILSSARVSATFHTHRRHTGSSLTASLDLKSCNSRPVATSIQLPEPEKEKCEG